MKNFNVLLTCCGMHVKERIDSLQQNEEGTFINVYACNCNPANLPPDNIADGTFVVPPITAPNYIDEILNICKEKCIDIIIPTVTLELEFMAANREVFEKNDIHVSISSPESLKVANNKIHLHQQFNAYMPKQIVISGGEDNFEEKVKAFDFFKRIVCKGRTLCCKLSDHCGGNGFAIIDNDKASDFTEINKFAGNTYISTHTFFSCLKNTDADVIVQEFIEGDDYSCSILACQGSISHIVGYYGYQMSHGAIVNGEIAYNDKAYKIAEKVVRELQLDGNICLDFRVSGDKTYLLEINPRVNASLPFVWKAGINMLYLRCKNLLGDFSDQGKPFPIKFGLKMRKYHDSRYYV